MTAGGPQGRLSEIIQLYLLRCDVEGKSQATVRAYRETLERFARIARKEGFPEEVDEIAAEHLYIYLGRLWGAKMSSVSGKGCAVSLWELNIHPDPV